MSSTRPHYAWTFTPETFHRWIEGEVCPRGRFDKSALRRVAIESAGLRDSAMVSYWESMCFDPSEEESWSSWFSQDHEDEPDLWYLVAMARYLESAPALSKGWPGFLEKGIEGSSWDRVKEVTLGRDLKELIATINHDDMRGTLKHIRGSLGGWLSLSSAIDLRKALLDDPPVPSPDAEKRYDEALSAHREALRRPLLSGEEMQAYYQTMTPPMVWTKEMDAAYRSGNKVQRTQTERALNFKNGFKLALDEAKKMLATAIERRAALRIVFDP